MPLLSGNSLSCYLKFPEPLFTPTTKADVGHDEDISREDILAQGLVDEAEYIQLEKYTRELIWKKHCNKRKY